MFGTQIFMVLLLLLLNDVVLLLLHQNWLLQVPGGGWISLLLEESRYQLRDLKPIELADITWAAAVFAKSYHPDGTWVTTCVDQTAVLMSGFNSKQWLRVLQGLAGLRAQPGREWLGMAVGKTQDMMGQCTGEELLGVLVALEGLGGGPVEQLMLQVLGRGTGPGVQQQQQHWEGEGEAGLRRPLPRKLVQ
jgi:hypothetical protein